MAMILFLVFSLFLQGALGEIICEGLPVGICSFSIASSGKRCLLETYESNIGTMGLQCKPSEVVVKNMPEWIESDECVNSCGLDRHSVGISSDSLIEPHFTAKLCSPGCYYNCPNIVDLYNNLALAEGVYLPDLCQTQRINPRRAMAELLSSGAAASGPVSAASGPASVEAMGPISSESSSVACAPSSI